MLKYIFPERFFITGGYLFAILLTVFLNSRRYTWGFSIAGAVLIIAAVLFPHRTLSSSGLLAEMLISLTALLLTMVIVAYIKQLHGSLAHEQQQVSSMFEFATEGIILTDAKGNILLINPAALRLFGYSRDEITGAPVETLIPDRFHLKHVSYRNSFHRDPSNRTMGKGRDLFAKKKGGEEFPVEVSLSYFKRRNEQFVIAFVVDITDRKKAEREMLEQKERLEEVSNHIKELNKELELKVAERTSVLKDALDELEHSRVSLSEALNKEKELNEIKSRFVSMASHEFRTPLSTILSSAALVGKYEKAEEKEKREKHVKRIREAVTHLNDLLEDFLSLGKLEEGKIEAVRDHVKISDFLREIADDLQGVFKPGQRVIIDSEGSDRIDTDKRLLRNILFNLLGNAIKFSGDGASIWLRAKENGDNLTIEVQDQGLGIPPQDMVHMFTSFFRASNVVNIQGTGLGLHIVKRYVDLLKGKIFISSELEKGTTVTLEIPTLQ